MDAILQSGINTLRGWKARREVNGKTVTAVDVERRASELWPDLTADQVAAIVAGVLA